MELEINVSLLTLERRLSQSNWVHEGRYVCKAFPDISQDVSIYGGKFAIEKKKKGDLLKENY
jgi:hypothetical protein